MSSTFNLKTFNDVHRFIKLYYLLHGPIRNYYMFLLLPYFLFEGSKLISMSALYTPNQSVRENEQAMVFLYFTVDRQHWKDGLSSVG